MLFRSLRLPCPDPWQFLIDAPVVHEEEKQILRAAQSQIFAVRKLTHMAMGMSTLKTDWHEEAAKARAKNDRRRYKHAVGKMADALILFKEVQDDVREQGDPELLNQMEQSWNKRRARLVHRGCKAEAKVRALPRWNAVREKLRLPAILTDCWVRSKLCPGFLFWRNEALTELLKNLLENQSLTPDVVKQTRRRLGLIPFGHGTICIWRVTIKRRKDGKLDITGYFRDHQRAF